ncbi:hydrogenase expression/formation protein HypD [Luminiphilus syltensis NOR5-1B]|uniref:Hydrogenase maturation factor n=1 Tax=Luminiphilus syltensis NOR5-1B TaxID=565045 RepID=B8KXU8_9GAMM|nr:hydrogenase formation protein HypD [Luminiphilus syltensis]EED34227.1 hydrogenase expression/formation protein HypD [Luminiphilus syltensis NOR5-1B]
MKHVDEYRAAETVASLADAIARATTQPWIIMEICGGQTHAIMRYGLDQILPKEITLIHGPGCPVCVTPDAYIDKALEIAATPGVIFCSFGDMLRVPGSQGDLLGVKARGGDVRIVYSPLDAVEIARSNPSREVVFFAIGFETTAPANAMAAYTAKREGLCNFSLLVSQVLVPPAMEALLSAPDTRVQGFLAAGHVCTVMGTEAYGPIAMRFDLPIVVTGFEPVDILAGVLACVRALEEGLHDVLNMYGRTVKSQGNAAARALIDEVFEVTEREWRGLGVLPASGLALRSTYAAFDAEARFGPARDIRAAPSPCISGEILRGVCSPLECAAFGASCTPDHPLGVTMVSSEGACAAYYRYRDPTDEVGVVFVHE